MKVLRWLAIMLFVPGASVRSVAEESCADNWFPAGSMSVERSLAYRTVSQPVEFWRRDAKSLRCSFETQLEALEQRAVFGKCQTQKIFRLLIQIDAKTNMAIVYFPKEQRLELSYSLLESRDGAAGVFRSSVRVDNETANRIKSCFDALKLLGSAQGLRLNAYLADMYVTHSYYWLAEACDYGRYGYALFEVPVTGVGGADAVSLLRLVNLGLEVATPAGLPNSAPRPKE